MTITPWVNQYGRAMRALPQECIDHCSASGAVDEAVTYWRRKLAFDIPRDIAERYLQSTGGWTGEELAGTDEVTLSERCLWLAACDASEGEWFGCCE